MAHAPIRDVVIAGGGTAGWMMAAAAARMLHDGQRRITLIESAEIGTVGVGEATIPPIVDFNRGLGIPEAEFVRETKATCKLGIEFRDWGRIGDRYVHPFGGVGRDLEGIDFHRIWLKFRDKPGVGGIGDYAMSAVAAHAGRFGHPVADQRSPLSQLAYAYHFDAGLYARYLRGLAEAGGVVRVEGKIARVERAENGHVQALDLQDGRRIAGELFIDCTGFRSLLLGQEMGVPFQDWSRWLPCDRALAVPTERRDPLIPLTRATARAAGWQWRIPLQHRTGNGHVWSSAFQSDAEAERALREGLDAPPQGEPRLLRFTAGRRERMWEGNVVAIGLSGGFLEPLESTSIHLIQSAIQKLLNLFPHSGFPPASRDTFNRLMNAQYDYVRDFVILHYKATARTDTPFWRQVGAMPIPDTLAEKIALFRESGALFRYADDLFATPSWAAVLLGQHIVPADGGALADALDEQRVAGALIAMRRAYPAAAATLPGHAEWIERLIG